MKPIKIEVCLGTTCFVMGGEGLQNMIEILQKKYGDKINVEAVRCLDICANEAFSKAPYVRLSGEIVSEANLEKLQNIIEKKINND